MVRRCAGGWLSGLALVALAACDSTPAPAGDAGRDAAQGPRDAQVPVAVPAPPGLLPCPPGWREVESDGVTTCDPYPEGGARTDCAADEAHFPGEAGCARVGSPCPADGWPEGLPADRPVLHVRAGSAAGGDGSRAAPLATVTEALALATPGTIVAVAEGTYAESIVIGPGVTVWGACVAATRLTSSVPHLNEAVVGFRGEGAVVRNLSIGGAPRPGILSLATSGVSLHMEDIVVSDVTGLGIALDGGRLTGRSVVVRDVRLDPSSGMFGRAIGAANATVELDRVVIERAFTTGAFAANPSCVYALSNAAIRDVRDNADGFFGRGASAQGGARLELTSVVIERARENGLTALGAGSTVALADVVVRDTLGRDANDEYGSGLHVERGARVTGERVVVERSRTHGAIASGVSSSLEVAHLVVRDTSPEAASGMYGAGVVLFGGASATLSSALVLRSHQAGIAAGDPGTTVSLSDVAVREVESVLADGRFGVGVWAQAGGVIDGQRVSVESARMTGVGAVGGASVTLEDARIAGVTSAECGDTTCPDEAAGMGAIAHLAGGRVRLTRFEIREVALCGVVVGRDGADDPGGEMDLASGLISGAPIGACVQIDEFETSRLRVDVLYVDVDIPLQATTYEIPSSLGLER